MIYLLLPVFNEEDNLPGLVDGLESTLSGMNKFYVFVDDGSTDRSVAVLGELMKGKEHVILGDGANHGPGFAFNTGFDWIVGHSSNDADRVVTLESDNTSGREILLTMLKISDTGFDLVLASVYAQGGGFDKTGFIRKTISFVANLFLRFMFDIKVLTLSSFYRVYTVSLLRTLKSKYKIIISEKGFISMIEILVKAIRVKASIIEVPMVLYSARRKGKSKMKVMKTMMGYLRFLLTSR